MFSVSESLANGVMHVAKLINLTPLNEVAPIRFSPLCHGWIQTGPLRALLDKLL